MNAEPQVRSTPPIEGYMIALDAGHSVAIYERDGKSYVAEFRDGVGEFAYAHTWFRFHAEVLKYCRNRRIMDHSSMPLPAETLEKIERLHSESESRQQRMLAMPRNAAAAVNRYLVTLISWTRGPASRTRRTVG
jgi:hypothetical protein